MTDEPSTTAPPPGPTRADVVVVFTGGDPLPASSSARLPASAYVIAADSGVEHAQALGRAIDLAVGDFDSVTPAALAAAEAAGTRVERHPAAKDRTDLELALDAALAMHPALVVVAGGAGGRLDHFLANALVLASPAYAAVEVEARLGPALVKVVRSRVELVGSPGDVVTLFAVGGPAEGVTTHGLRYPLHDDTLHPGSTRGVSNELVRSPATVSVASGVILAVLPGDRGTHHDPGVRP